jgi:WD40 repeat protein
LKASPDAYHCAFSPDGKTLATATGSEVIYLWETTTGQLRRRFQGGVAAGFSADGQSLIAVTHDGLVRRFALPACKLIGPDETIPRTDFLYVSGVAFARDGERVVLHDDWTTVIKEVATGRILCRATLSDAILSVSLSPDGKTLAVW